MSNPSRWTNLKFNLGLSNRPPPNPDYWHDKYDELNEASTKLASHTQDLITENTHIKELLKMSDTNKIPSSNEYGVYFPLKEGALVVPVALSSDIVVQIVGLPGRPTVAACERLCKVIMAYAVEPVAPHQVSVNVTNNSKEPIDVTIKRDEATIPQPNTALAKAMEGRYGLDKAEQEKK